MTTLEAKFEALEAQIATQHTAISNSLDALLSALGVPPPTATTTLGDINASMIALNNNLIGIAIANGSFHAAMLDAMALINVNTDTLITNNSLNAQRMLSAILSTACACDTGVPFTQPILDVTPTSLEDEAKCRRVQYYLSIFSAMIDGIANYGGAGAMVTSAAVTEIMYAAVVGGGLVGGEVGAVGGPPGIVLGAIVGIIGALIASLGSSYIYSMSAQWHQEPLPTAVLDALYSADSADAGASAFNIVIDASDVLNAPFKPLIKALFWNGWANDIYSDVPVVDDSAFDGSICAPPPSENCQIYDIVMREDGFGVGVWTDDPDALANNSNPGDFEGYRLTLTSCSEVFAEFTVACTGTTGGTLAIFNGVGQSVIVDRPTATLSFATRYNNTITAATFELCPPGTFIP